MVRNVFFTYNPPVSPAIQKTLNAQMAAASRGGFPVKVALSSRRSTNPVHQKPPDGQIDDLAWAAITALAKIAAASGHPIGVPAASSAGTRGGSSAGIVAIVVGVVMATSVALLIVRRRRAAGRGFS